MLPCRGPTGCLAPPGCSPVQGSGGALLQASIPPVFGSTPSPAACSPRGRGARGVECPSPALAAEVTHCSVTPGAFGLLGRGAGPGIPSFGGSWCKAFDSESLPSAAPHPYGSPRPCTKCRPAPQCSRLIPLWGPSEIHAPWGSQELGRPGAWAPSTGCGGAGGGRCGEAIRGSQPKPRGSCRPRAGPSG